jgi:DNA alkylation repair enzyme
MELRAALAELRSRADPTRKPGMARVGIQVSRALGVSIPDVRAVAKRCGIDQDLELELWRTGIHEARILATLVADPARIDEKQKEDPRMGAAARGIRQAMCILDDRPPSRLGEGRPGPRVHRVPAAHPSSGG